MVNLFKTLSPSLTDILYFPLLFLFFFQDDQPPPPPPPTPPPSHTHALLEQLAYPKIYISCPAARFLSPTLLPRSPVCQRISISLSKEIETLLESCESKSTEHRYGLPRAGSESSGKRFRRKFREDGDQTRQKCSRRRKQKKSPWRDVASIRTTTKQQKCPKSGGTCSGVPSKTYATTSIFFSFRRVGVCGSSIKLGGRTLMPRFQRV